MRIIIVNEKVGKKGKGKHQVSNEAVIWDEKVRVKRGWQTGD